MANYNEEILYVYKDKVYLNITNKCPCACTFCIRSKKDAIGSASNLWLNHNPSFNEVKEAIDNFDFSGFSEAIFCGYGEPTCAFIVLIKTAKYLREKLGIKLRINTNGLGNLINSKDITRELCENVDAVSVSLNCSNKEDYLQTVRPKFGIKSYDAMLEFAQKCKAYTDNVTLSVVDIIGEEEIKKCRQIADKLGIELRVRQYSGSSQ
ncbi:MAG: TIGR04100 family radical SAM protein [Clostridiales bacterium]|nr:TIGR04100 family radical SAM protein [Clostridiales bacterium]